MSGYSQYKPRFNRSTPPPKKISGINSPRGAKLAPENKIGWRPISMKTLGYLAATAKIGILQVHGLIGDGPNKTFARAFLEHIDLRRPTEKDMEQIHLFSHLLFA
jgi:hypothetical protein